MTSSILALVEDKKYHIVGAVGLINADPGSNVLKTYDVLYRYKEALVQKINHSIALINTTFTIRYNREIRCQYDGY